ncbi:MAG TPA: SH3 domain-containing protein [Thermoanaerobaculia bacterium]|nr:SH3 domain-containing protein [Thermoanaerobaculia bacterium]
MRRLMILSALLLLGSCTEQEPPVTAPERVAPHLRPAIKVLYVGVPTLIVHAAPNDTSPEVGRFGYTETVSILAEQGDWVEIRTVDGSGWARTAELITGQQAEEILRNPTPRFLREPAKVPDPRAHGTILLEAKVNTDGEVVDVKVVRNTTNSRQLAEANAEALKAAAFYPMIQKGKRVAFTYQHTVYY